MQTQQAANHLRGSLMQVELIPATSKLNYAALARCTSEGRGFSDYTFAASHGRSKTQPRNCLAMSKLSCLAMEHPSRTPTRNPTHFCFRGREIPRIKGSCEQRSKFLVWRMVNGPVLVLQSRSFSLYIIRSMLGRPIRSARLEFANSFT